MEDIKEYYMQIPPVTRYYLTLVFILTFCMTYKILSPYSLILDFEAAIFSLHVINFNLLLVYQLFTKQKNDKLFIYNTMFD